MSRLGSILINNAISKWALNSIHNPSPQCYVIINRYINSDSLFNELNSSFKKLKESKQSSSTQNKAPIIQQQNTKSKNPKTAKFDERKSKSKSKSKPRKPNVGNKQLIKSISLVDNDKTITSIKQRNDDNYLSRIHSMDDNAITRSESMFDKYGKYYIIYLYHMSFI